MLLGFDRKGVGNEQYLIFSDTKGDVCISAR